MTHSWKRYLKLSRRRFLKGAAATAVATGFYTWRIEPHWLQVVERDLPVPRLPRNLAGTTLAQLSDLHIGPQVDDSYLLGVFDRVRALAPQIVVYTGDFVTCAADALDHARQMFPHLPQGTRATFGILGNHDYGHEWSDTQLANELAAVAQSHGVHILRNELAEVDALQIVGLDDLWAGRFEVQKAFASSNPSRPAIALTHNPDTADCSGWDKHTGWILAGHTHGGQCKAPFLPPPLIPVKNRRYTSGEFDLAGDRRMYISRGVGHLLRVRINARPEVTLFTLTTA